ncbi:MULTISPECIES: right-handed parallel beta-helix repeat-containing protein [unclassified Pseudarthrobacter]|uniref:right-handed parallel beta-helix repeat-containing protein n=1 Tax=unclassified Pseudarthrobacter TaxID=2647000 RepID=UPI00249B68B2|nr:MULTISPECIES: right-handed parallel beta-helix repeat-containing protein [unclassified Pseudarthrobacter]MDI3196029.1 right-handed parallel beta-helix repeat-containing protein [Pseudarthrobacter sp. AL20]
MKKKWLARTTAAGLALALPAIFGTAPSFAEGAGSQYFVDCAAGAAGNGSAASPWNSLQQANAHEFGPGDQLLFMKGTTCTGLLKPSGSGTAADAFTISDYGTSSGRAVIAGQGGPTAVHLLNNQHIVLQNLEITNSALPASQRRGVLVEIRDIGTGTGYDLENLYIHDVRGGDLKGPNGSQGIGFKVSGSAVPTKFDDVRIAGNRLEHIDRQAIVTVLSTWSARPELTPTPVTTWLASTNIVVEHNTLSDIGGDGIVMNTTDGAIVQRNTVSGFQLRSAGYNAGIWPFNSDNSTFQYNDVSGGGNTLDGMAYDVDQGNVNTTFQYNYSHDNKGGFFLLCNNGPGMIRNADIHHNLSINDSFRGIENCKGAVESAAFHQNWIYIGDGISQTVVNENTASLRNVRFQNNVVVKAGAGTADFKLLSGGYKFACNEFTGTTHTPAQSAEGDTCQPIPAASHGMNQGLLKKVLDGEYLSRSVQDSLSRIFGARSTAGQK